MVADGPVPMAVLAPWPPSNRGGVPGGWGVAARPDLPGWPAAVGERPATGRLETPPVARRQGLLDGLVHEYHAVAA
jgi:hypothetical protein